jgi:hypothetical protein
MNNKEKMVIPIENDDFLNWQVLHICGPSYLPTKTKEITTLLCVGERNAYLLYRRVNVSVVLNSVFRACVFRLSCVRISCNVRLIKRFLKRASFTSVYVNRFPCIVFRLSCVWKREFVGPNSTVFCVWNYWEVKNILNRAKVVKKLYDYDILLNV